MNASGSMSQRKQSQLKEMITKYQGLFAGKSTEHGCTDTVSHTIDTGDNAPVKQLARSVPFALRKTIDTMVEEMLQQEVEKPSRSPPCCTCLEKRWKHEILHRLPHGEQC